MVACVVAAKLKEVVLLEKDLADLVPSHLGEAIMQEQGKELIWTCDPKTEPSLKLQSFVGEA